MSDRLNANEKAITKTTFILRACLMYTAYNRISTYCCISCSSNVPHFWMLPLPALPPIVGCQIGPNKAFPVALRVPMHIPGSDTNWIAFQILSRPNRVEMDESVRRRKYVGGVQLGILLNRGAKPARRAV
jgi:hypothetical protein